ALALTENVERDLVTGTLRADRSLKLAGIFHLLTVEFGDYVANFQSGLGSGRVGLNLAHQRAAGVRKMEEARVFRSHIVNPDAHARVLDLAVLEQRVNHGSRNLRRNGKAHAGEASRRRDQEGVDADHFTVSIHQRATGISRID